MFEDFRHKSPANTLPLCCYSAEKVVDITIGLHIGEANDGAVDLGYKWLVLL